MSITIYEIKARTAETSPYFFAPKTIKFFGQTIRSFSVKKQPDGRYLISAPMKDMTQGGRLMGYTQRLFNPETNELDRVPVGYNTSRIAALYTTGKMTFTKG